MVKSKKRQMEEEAVTMEVTTDVTETKRCKVMEDQKHNKIYNSVMEAIGNTPLIRLNKVVPSSVQCEMLVKCEFFNAGGSVKDRIGHQMVEDAEKAGKIKPGDTLIEPTSGNTGIGIALAAATKGYRCIICLPEKMSKEKVDVLKALGSEIVRTPTEAAYDAPDSHISVAKRLNLEIPNSHILDQYSNPSNPDAHYYGTAEEIWNQCNGKVDMLVAGAGTGGTITGIAKRLKELNPSIQIIGVDPEGSILAQPEDLNEKNRLHSYEVEGIGYDFIPNVLDRSLVDKWYKSNDKDSLVMMRKLIRDEGLLCGGSCGAAVSCAIIAAQSLPQNARCVVILPDSVRNYMSKALSDDWMLDRKFVDEDVIKSKKYQTWWASKRVSDIAMTTPVTITSDVTVKDAVALLKNEGFDMVPVLDMTNGNVLGVVTEGNMTSKIIAGRAKPDSSVLDAGVIYKTFHKFKMDSTLSEVAQALDHDPYALVITTQRCFTNGSNTKKPSVVTRSVVSGIVTRIDLLDYVSSGDTTTAATSSTSTSG
uniref:Cystathionine beta-synthase n=1 Tax=Ditylum brightwellii TaxID=49249 RepID=A0A7S1ZAK1_9STRA|mmetsp:Transcript_28035/g.41704  ORF Transcript_28035/g.41704 Transcript_28035/m.41704 type:complete len:534 (+) Transcript_28035:37-1638(+)